MFPLPEIGPALHAGDGLLMFWSHQPIAPWQTEAWLAENRANRERKARENVHVTGDTSEDESRVQYLQSRLNGIRPAYTGYLSADN